LVLLELDKWHVKRLPMNASLLIIPQGLGIALVAAQKAGVSVALVDTNQASIDKGLKFAGTTS
jgi:hypothetical protein